MAVALGREDADVDAELLARAEPDAEVLGTTVAEASAVADEEADDVALDGAAVQFPETPSNDAVKSRPV